MYQIASPTITLRTTPTVKSEPAATLHRPPVATGETLFLLGTDVVALAAAGFATDRQTPIVMVLHGTLVLLAFAIARLYRERLCFSVFDDLPRLLAATVAGVWLSGLSLTTAAVVITAVVVARVVGYRLLRGHRRRSPGRVTLLLGCDGIAEQLAEALSADRSYGMVPVGFVGTAPPNPPRLPVLAPVDGLQRAIKKYKPVHLIVTFPDSDNAELVSTLRRCRRTGVVVHVVPRLSELVAGLGGAELINGIPLVRLRPEPAQSRRWAAKRALDVVGASIGLLLLSPVLLLCAIAAWCEFRRHGVIFKQERIGRDGKPFTILKFRSLTPATSLESQVKWNINTDMRLGPVGKLLRFSSLDELPQLLNVLRGDMSLVGPRPERPYFVEQFERAYSGYADRHRVPSGITGWAQIHGLRGDTSIEDRVRFDNHYIEHWSLALDLKIILRTVGSMISIHRV